MNDSSHDGYLQSIAEAQNLLAGLMGSLRMPDTRERLGTGDAVQQKEKASEVYDSFMQKAYEYGKALKTSKYRGFCGRLLKITDRLGITSKHKRYVALRGKYESTLGSAFEAKKTLTGIVEKLESEEETTRKASDMPGQDGAVGMAYSRLALYQIHTCKEHAKILLGVVDKYTKGLDAAVSCLEKQDWKNATIMKKRFEQFQPAVKKQPEYEIPLDNSLFELDPNDLKLEKVA
ncbi:MAG: hypothetical protein QXM31_00885 [Candidatus Woesearchaeota archaeon]